MTSTSLIPASFAHIFRRYAVLFYLLLSVIVMIAGNIKKEEVERMQARTIDIVVPLFDALTQPVEAFRNAKQALANYLDVYEENDILREKLNNYQLLQDQLYKVTLENHILRKLVRAIPEPRVSYYTARVINNAGGPFAHIITINAGEEHGIRKGMVVLNNEGLIGRIQKVAPHSSRVILLTDLNSRVPVISQHSMEKAIAAGNNQQMLKLLYTRPDHKLKEGEPLFTSGDGEYFPPGIRVGTIKSIDHDNITVKPVYERHRLHFVMVAFIEAPQ